MKKIKIKLAERISISFVLLFVSLMVFGTFFIVSFLKFQANSNLKGAYSKKIDEVNLFLNKIESFSKKYDNITLEFNPRLENQNIVYSKPFEPGAEEFLYIIRVRNSNDFDEIALNTLDSKQSVKEIKENITEINKNTTNSTVNKNISTRFTRKNNIYSVIRINRVISGNVFDVYILKDVTSDFNTYKTLILVLLLYTAISVIFIIIISNKLTSKMLKPINRIIQTASAISTKDLTVRIDSTNTDDELDNLISIINSMLDRLNIAFDNQSKFISDVSHELRTPLAIIHGYADFIQRHSKTSDEILKESILLIMKESDNMKNLVEKLLFLARGDASTVIINIETFDSSSFITQVYNDSEFISADHNIVIEKNEKYTILADRSLLLQAIRTIIENSVKYSEKNSNIYLHSEFNKETKEAVISIRDEGIGIEEKYFKKIFERFYRVDESRTNKTGGTGLGLSIVKKILDIHGGRVEVESKVNEGSKFTLYIPSKSKKS